MKKQITIGAISAAAFILLLMFGLPLYWVWTAKKDGEAELSKAQYNRKIAIEEADAKEVSAQKLANADTTRAHGIARSNEIIGGSLKDNKEYLKWLFIDALDKTQNQIIYVPTENSIPILESTRLLKNNLTSPPAEE